MDDLSLTELMAAAAGGDVTAAIMLLATGFLMLSAPFVVIELGWLIARRALTWRRIREMLASYSTVPPALLTQGAAYAAWFAVYVAVGSITPFAIATTWATALLCLLLADFTYYWDHRLGHEVRGLWSLYHSVHHSSPVFDQSTSFRISFVDQFVVPVFYLPLVVVGFNPLLVSGCSLAVVAYQGWIHTEMIGRLGPLDLVFNTPSNHRVHHGAQPEYRDRNYGGILMVWDRLFGTYQAELSRPAYGLVEPINSVNPLIVHFCELLRLRRRA